MASGEKKRRSFLGTLLKVILIIVLIVVTLIVGGYLVLRFALGIDVIDIKKKINLLNENVSETQLITNPYTDDNAVDGFNVIFGNGNIYVKNEDGTYTFNEEEFNNSIVSGEIQLSAEQLASCTNVFIKNFVTSSVDVSGVSLSAELKQLAFSNLRSEENTIKVDVNSILKFDFKSLKDEIIKSNNFLGNLISKYIPNSVYLSIDAELSLDTLNNNAYTVTPKSILINNLTKTQSQEIIDLFSKLYSDKNVNLVDDITNQFTNMIFSCSDGGLFGSLNITSFTFVQPEAEGNVYIVLN